jgi:predicted permease
MLIGFVMMIFHIRPEGVIDETMTMIGDITIPMSMILVGIRLGSVKFGEIINKNNIIMMLGSKAP